MTILVWCFGREHQKNWIVLDVYGSERTLHLPDTPTSDKERKEAYEATLGTGRVFLFDHFGSTSVENIVNRVRYMAKALNCKYIFVDHISIIVSAQDNGDERKAIDSIMTKLRTLVQETEISFVCCVSP